MCGICGIASSIAPPSRELIRRMCDAIVHRGPDGEGFYFDACIGMGMRRLAVIDLVTGDQPMSNETGSVQVVFNGEIYNYRELRRQLEQRGHRFRTSSDTEVIPHLYEQYGLDFPSRLNGIFAIGLWDAELRRLLVVRDRLGVKPLFYAVNHQCFYFGSEIKCILAANGSDLNIDLEGVDQFLTLEYTASPSTLLSDVKKLPAGSWLTWKDGKTQEGVFWRLPDSQSDPGWSDEQWARGLREVLDDAVKRQMVSDVPLGAFLSGGVDSSILVSAMSRASNRPVRTFSIGFAEQSYNELHYARQAAQRCQTDHTEVILRPDYLNMVEEVVYHMDQPIGDFSVFPTLLVSKAARENVTVALSGDGGDELFSGYDAYIADRLAQRTVDRFPSFTKTALRFVANRLPLSAKKKGWCNGLRRFFEGACQPVEWQHMRWMTFLSTAQRKELYSPDVCLKASQAAERAIIQYLDNPGSDRLQRQLYADTRFYLVENILCKVDMMSMAASLETRVPYLDNEVVDFVLRMPSRLKWRGGQRKYILKRAYSQDLPRDILARRKQGFSIPLKSWLRREWNGLMHDVLEERRIRRDGLFNWRAVQRLVHEHESGRANHSHILWGLMVFHMWKRRFVESAVAPPAVNLCHLGTSP